MISEQMELDYMQAAQQRVAADTQLLEKRADVTIPAGAASVVLPAEVISISAVYNGTQPLTLIPTVEYMRIATGSPITHTDPAYRAFFVVISRTLYVWPGNGGVTSTATTPLLTSPSLLTSPTLLTGGSSTTVAGPDLILTLFYTYRPASITSDSMFEFTGYAKRLIERLTSAYSLFDDGQPELGQQELVAYQNDAKRVAHRNRAAQGTGGRLQIAGRRRGAG